MYEKNWSEIKTEGNREKKEVTNHKDGYVQAPRLSSFLDHKSQHILRKRLPTFLLGVVQRFQKTGMP